MEAHRVVLASSSPVFENILKRNKHTHPLLYMKGMKSGDLLAILDFLYCGETNVYQENLDSFLSIAEELQLKGLMGKSVQEENMHLHPSEFVIPQDASFKVEQTMTKFSDILSVESTSKDSLAGTAVVTNEVSGDDIQKLDEQIFAMMTKGSRKNAQGKSLYVCHACGKESVQSQMKDHIEANHLEGISLPCNYCDKIFRSRHITYHLFADQNDLE